ncbi:MAG: MFS transporter [Phycisphaerae bacterium]
MPGFFMAFLLVAVGAAVFKPVVVGTVAKVTDESNSATGFGIFYMMVNVGGFVGPIVAGIVRGQGWHWVFVACSAWAVVNLVLVLTLYREPPRPAADRRRLSQVLENLVEVLGNLRFFISVGAVLVGLMVGGMLDSLRVSWFSWKWCGLLLLAWVVANLLYDRLLPAGEAPPGRRRNPLLRRMRCGNWRFALFLLIMSGFWTAFNQIFYTMPEYIRDFVDTRPLIRLAESLFGPGAAEDPQRGIAARMATINQDERGLIVGQLETLLAAARAGTLDEPALAAACRRLLNSKVRISPSRLRELLQAPDAQLEHLTNRVMVEGRQVNPEFIINIDAGAIVLFQVLISFLMGRFHRFTTMILGMLVAAIGIGLSALAGGAGMVGSGALVWIVAGGILIFAFGEMMASPTSQEYVGRVAPADKKALYMGYYFVAVALGNLFGGILSGQLYGKLARDLQRPDLMWAAFGGLMVVTAVLFLLYDRLALPRRAAYELTPDSTRPGG